MENGGTPSRPGSGTVTPRRTPPPPPNPNGPSADEINEAYRGKSDEPLKLDSERWDITTISGLGALRMFMMALEQLAEATGDVPPTPPVTRPSTPKRQDSGKENMPDILSSPPPTAPDVPVVNIGSPEASIHEPVAVVGANAVDHIIQHAAIARRFFSKVAPPFTLAEYLLRLHQYCPHSPAVYFEAAAYCHRLCVSDYMVPATNRTIHRLALAAIRIAAKSLEDNKWTQERYAMVGGVSKAQLLNLEITLLFLLDFELGITAEEMARRMFLLQQAAEQKLGAQKLEGFRLNLPGRRKMRTLSRS